MDQWMQEVTDKLDDILKRLAKLEAATKPETVTIQEIASDLDVSYEWVRSRPWVQPNYGKPDLTGRPKRWKWSTWESWRKDLDGHQQRWESMTPQKRRRLIA